MAEKNAQSFVSLPNEVEGVHVSANTGGPLPTRGCAVAGYFNFKADYGIRSMEVNYAVPCVFAGLRYERQR